MTDFISVSAVGRSRPIDVVLHELIDRGAQNIELAVGTTASSGDDWMADAWEAGVNFRAHASFPAFDHIANPRADYMELLRDCVGMGIHSYSMHPLPMREYEEPTTWAIEHFLDAYNHGISLSLETMYPAPQNYWLASYGPVMDFLEFAANNCLTKPLVIDCAHLNICVQQGSWTFEQVCELIRLDVASEVHYSSNDGVHDTHRIYRPERDDMIQKWLALVPEGTVLVDEGRRR